MTEKAKKIINENKIAVACILLSILLITIVNPNSILYKASTCSDAGIYYNVAKGMVQGKVLYSDIYDHKGPFIFFIYEIYNLMFPCKLYGAYIMDLICYVLIYIFTYRLFILKQDKVAAALCASAYIILLIFMNNSFGCPEIFAVLLESVILYWTYTDKINDKKYLIFFGLMVGMLLMIKFTLTAFPFIMFFYFLYFNLKIEKSKNQIIIKNFLILITGMLLPIMLSLIYLIKNNAFDDFIRAYIVANKGYASEGFGVVLNSCICLTVILATALNRKWQIREKLLVSAILMQFTLILSSHIYNYALLPVLVVLVLIIYHTVKLEMKLKKIICAEILLILVVAIFAQGVCGIKANHQRENIVAGANDITLMNVAAYVFNEQGEAPKNKYFFTPNLDCETNRELWDELYRMVNEKIPDNIYIYYDGYKLVRNKRFAWKNIHNILVKLKENYRCVKKYEEGIYKWERKQ